MSHHNPDQRAVTTFADLLAAAAVPDPRPQLRSNRRLNALHRAFREIDRRLDQINADMPDGADINADDLIGLYRVWEEAGRPLHHDLPVTRKGLGA